MATRSKPVAADSGTPAPRDPNFPPVGDIQMKKSKGTFNTYQLELSYGQIVAIQQALRDKHDDPIADDLMAMFDYYMKELPGPGEDEEKLKDREQAAKAAEDDFPIPMPPGRDTVAPEEGGEAPEGDVPTEELPELGAAESSPEQSGEEGSAAPDESAGEDELERALRDVEADDTEAAKDDLLPPEPPAE